MLATVTAPDSTSTVRKKYSVFIYSEAEPHAMYAIYKQTLKLCVLQYPRSVHVPTTPSDSSLNTFSPEIFSHIVGSFLAALQYRNQIPAPVDRLSAIAWLYKHPWLTCQKNKQSTPKTHVICKSKLRSVLRSSMHPWPGSLVAIGRVVVYYAQVVRAFSAGIKYQHCNT